MLASLAAALLLSSALAGCAARLDVPAPAAYAPSSQLTSRAAHHWDVMAADIATHLAERLRDWPPGEHPVSYTHLTLPTNNPWCRSRWSPYH